MIMSVWWLIPTILTRLQWTLVIVNAWIVNDLSLVNIFDETGRLFYNMNYMLNSKHSLVNKIGDKTEFTITRVHCSWKLSILLQGNNNKHQRLTRLSLATSSLKIPKPTNKCILWVLMLTANIYKQTLLNTQVAFYWIVL